MKDNEYETIEILIDLFTYITVGLAALVIISLLIRAAFQEDEMSEFYLEQLITKESENGTRKQP